MKKVFRIRDRVFWASNGHEIRDYHYMAYTENVGWHLHRIDKPRIQVEIVYPPSNRCPNCGHKVK